MKDVEILTTYSNFTYKESCLNTDGFQLHCHSYYEIYYFVSGEVDYLVEGMPFHPTPHSLLLLAPGQFHGVHVNTNDVPYCRYSLHFHGELLSIEHRQLLLSIFKQDPEKSRSIYLEHLEGSNILPCLKMLASLSKMNSDFRENFFPVYTESLLSQILLRQKKEGRPDYLTATPEVISKIIHHLNTHLSEPLHLDDISEKFYISKHHLNKVFRKATGTTLGDYVLHKRVTLAQQLLSSGHNSQDAAAMAGFSDYSAFYRAYKKILGHSPIADRGKTLAMLGQDVEKIVVPPLQ